MAGSVSDVLDRRTQSSYRDARAAADAAASVAALIGPELGWDADRIRAEADAYARTRAPRWPGPDSTRAGGRSRRPAPDASGPRRGRR